jgi:hypothetical protein
MYYEKKYSPDITEIINNTVLSNQQEDILKSCLNLLINKDSYYVFEDMYKLYLNNYSLIEISKLYNRSPRMIQVIFKNVGLNRNRCSAQQIAAKKRDYVAIRKKYKNTIFERATDTQLFGSKIEQYIRYEFCILLNEIFPNYEVLVGINTMTKVGELDIPIILLDDDKFYKYGIEVDGEFFHIDEKRGEQDISKSNKLNKLGYKIFRLKTKAYYNNEHIPKLVYENEIKLKVIHICEKIYNDMINNR